MIVVTVGTQLPFDRLIAMVDGISPNLKRKVFAQIGPTSFEPENIEWSKNVDPSTFDGLLKNSSVIVSHAGMGTVLKAYKFMKPIILVPRRAALGEHRNDHQLASVSQLTGRPGVYIANSKDELQGLLEVNLSPAVPSEQTEIQRVALQRHVYKIAQRHAD